VIRCGRFSFMASAISSTHLCLL